MDKLKILVACHKEADVPNNDVYLPIHVGKALHPDLDLGFIGDNTGDNISDLNPYYCELTAEYWGWKNLDCQYIGLQHYRRYFNFEFKINNIDSMMDGYDIILPTPYYYAESLYNMLLKALYPEEIFLFYNMVKRKFSAYFRSFDDFLSMNKFYACNIFITRMDTFKDFAAWQFEILDSLYKLCPKSPYTRGKRLMGYLGEVLLPIYCIDRSLKIRELPLAPFIGSKKLLLHDTLWDKLKKNIMFKLSGRHSLNIRKEWIIGLEADHLI